MITKLPLRRNPATKGMGSLQGGGRGETIVHLRALSRKAYAGYRTDRHAMSSAVVREKPETSMSELSQRCRKLLYRMMWQTPDGIVDAFALCATREDARRFFCSAISLISGIHQDELELFNLESFDDLVNAGVSEDEDMRIFETQWSGARVVGWTTQPLFLTSDPTLIARWADLRAELAAAQTNSVISRISGRGC